MSLTRKLRPNHTDDMQCAGAALSTLLDDWLTRFGPSALFQTCETCKHMSEQGPAHCSKFNMTPPASVILSGCDDYDDKGDIPF